MIWPFTLHILESSWSAEACMASAGGNSGSLPQAHAHTAVATPHIGSNALQKNCSATADPTSPSFVGGSAEGLLPSGQISGVSGVGGTDKLLERAKKISFRLSVRPSANCPDIAVNREVVKKFPMRFQTEGQLNDAVIDMFKLPGGLDYQIVDQNDEDQIVPKPELLAGAGTSLHQEHDGRQYEVVFRTPEKAAEGRREKFVPKGLGQGLPMEKTKRGRPQAIGKESTAGKNDILTLNQHATVRALL
jgi:hypothetical protein